MVIEHNVKVTILKRKSTQYKIVTQYWFGIFNRYQLNSGLNKIEVYGLPWWSSGWELPTKGTQAWSLVREDLTCLWTTKPVHGYWDCALEPGSHNCWSLCALEPTFCNKRSPCLLQLEKAHARQQRPGTARNTDRFISPSYSSLNANSSRPVWSSLASGSQVLRSHVTPPALQEAL